MTKQDNTAIEQEVKTFQDYTASWGYPMNQEAHEKGLKIVLEAIQQHTEKVLDEAKEDTLDCRKFIAALLTQSGGVVTVTKRTLMEVENTIINFERLDNIDGSVTMALEQNTFEQLTNPTEAGDN